MCGIIANGLIATCLSAVRTNMKKGMLAYYGSSTAIHATRRCLLFDFFKPSTLLTETECKYHGANEIKVIINGGFWCSMNLL